MSEEVIRIPLYCEICKKETMHNILEKKVYKKSIKLKVKCLTCRTVNEHTENSEGRHKKDVKLIISYRDISNIENSKLDNGSTYSVGDVLTLNEKTIKIIKIDTINNRHVRYAKGSDIHTLWTLNYDKIPVKVSINRNRVTESHIIEVKPEHIFKIGDVMNLFGMSVTITSIKAIDYLYKKGSVEAADIVRIYTKKRFTRRLYRH
ncbi:MAG: hypothetical protein M1481_05860 [Candidatus Thermoplasmatota archaeon]|nr:hypothetical protein [Candidatus Thermoplasmatota archaeon]MCL5962942.1 hypothetical protein [Candidatus Thermoplasmatota archaeon]